MNNIPNINKFGAAKRPNIKNLGGPRGGVYFGEFSEIIYVNGFFSLSSSMGSAEAVKIEHVWCLSLRRDNQSMAEGMESGTVFYTSPQREWMGCR